MPAGPDIHKRGRNPSIMNRFTIAALAEQVLSGQSLSRPQADWLAALPLASMPELFTWSDRIRHKHFGNTVRCCSIVSAQTGSCSEDCAFCSQSSHYSTLVEGLTVLQPDPIFNAAMQAADNGAKSFGIVASGYAPKDEDIEHWAGTIRRIRETGRLELCASIGVLNHEQAKRLAKLGVACYNHNLQTSRNHFPKIIKTHAYDDRLQTLRCVRNAGMRVCSGALFGMGESWNDRLDLAFELREIDPEIVPLNFLIAIDGTPLQGTQPLPPMECLHIIAVYRFLLPHADIKIAGGREVNIRDLQSWIFMAGASSFLIGNYLTTCGRDAKADHQMVRDLGLVLKQGDPDSPRPHRD